MKFCKDCKHVGNTDSPSVWWVCMRSPKTSLIDGVSTPELCGIVRATVAQCGVEGEWFEARKKEPRQDADDEEERYENEDERLDSEQHGQAEGLNSLRYKP